MKTELLAPAGDPEKLKAAVLYGADAVYLGGRHFGLRAGAGNFDEAALAEGVRFAHAHGARVYVTVNIFAHNRDLELLPPYLETISKAGADAVIVSDPGMIGLIRQQYPALPVHLSTQANTTNWAAARFWEEHGIKRIVLARELTLEEIREIRGKVSLELEIFVHGAMCISYSGRCLLSSYMTGRGANRGDCAQSCRWKYALVEEKRPGEYFPIAEDSRGSYILGARDLCLIEHIPALIKAGINSFKIEGRMKSVNYVAGVVKAYREALDAYHREPENYRFNPAWLEEIEKVSHRDYSTGFLFGRPGPSGQHYEGEVYKRSHVFAGLVRGYESAAGLAVIEQRNRFAVGDEVEFMLPRGENLKQKITMIIDAAGQAAATAPHPQQVVRIPVDGPVPEFAIMRRLIKDVL
jgi:putative protease